MKKILILILLLDATRILAGAGGPEAGAVPELPYGMGPVVLALIGGTVLWLRGKTRK